MDLIKTLLKILVIAFVYLGAAPVLGILLKGRATAQRIALGCMAFMLVRPRSEFTLMLDSIDWYRGHCRGFEFNFLEAVAMAFALCAWLEKRKDFRFFPPGLWIWLLWVTVSLLSAASALEPSYAFMPAVKFAKMGFVLIGIFAILRDERDIKAMMRGFAIGLIIQIIVCLWARYVHGSYRVLGWFEHQNPMAIWSYTVALPMLGLILTKRTSKSDMLLFSCAYGAAGLAVVFSVSRASLGLFGIGTMAVMLGSFTQGVSIKKTALVALMSIAGVLVMLKAADTFMARMGSDDSPKNDLRYALNKQSAAMFRDHPVIGTGWNNYGLLNSRPRGAKYSKIMEDWERARGSTIYLKNFRGNPLTESLYWLTLAETGALGLTTFMCFALFTLWCGTRASLAFWKSSLGLMLFGATVALALNYFHGQYERVLTQTKILTTWMMICALVIKADWWRKQQKLAKLAAKNPTSNL